MKNYWLILQNKSSQNIFDKLKDLNPLVISSNELFGEDVEVKGAQHLNISLSLFKKPFYLLPKIKKLISALYISFLLKKTIHKLSKPDVIIYTNDGIFQRLILRLYPKAKKVMFLQGVLSGNEHQFPRSFFVQQLYKIVPKLYRPSTLGVSNPNLVFVFTRQCGEYLRKNGLLDSTIIETGINIDAKKFSFDNGSGGIEIIFLAQAFDWHGLNAYSKIMNSEIEIWEKWSKSNGVKFRVRPHPRTSLNELINYDIADKLPKNKSQVVFIGLNSTLLLELAAMGYKVCISDLSGANWSANNSFGRMPSLKLFKKLPLSLSSLLSKTSSDTKTFKELNYKLILNHIKQL